MRIVTWNCQGALRHKHASLAGLRPDLAIVPESGPFENSNDAVGAKPIRSVLWFGDIPTKGLAVVSYGAYSVEVHEGYDPSLQWVVPLKVVGPRPFTLLAVWTVPHPESRLYVQCLFEALEIYRQLLASPRVVWAGDFNNNFLLDKPHHALKFADFVTEMSKLGFSSLYHLQSGSEHGREAEPTFFMNRKKDRGYHIDFLFSSPAVHEHGFEITVGKHSEWASISDHMPLACSFVEPLEQ